MTKFSIIEFTFFYVYGFPLVGIDGDIKENLSIVGNMGHIDRHFETP